MRGSIAQIKEGALRGVATAQTGVIARTAQFADAGLRSRLTLLAAAALVPLMAAGTAVAQNGCNSTAAGKLFDFVNSFAKLLIGFGAVGSVLMFAVGAGLIMFSGTNEGRARAGQKIVKNVFIALAIFGGAVFFKFVILNLVQAAMGDEFKTADCLKKDNKNGDPTFGNGNV